MSHNEESLLLYNSDWTIGFDYDFYLAPTIYSVQGEMFKGERYASVLACVSETSSMYKTMIAELAVNDGSDQLVSFRVDEDADIDNLNLKDILLMKIDTESLNRKRNDVEKYKYPGSLYGTKGIPKTKNMSFNNLGSSSNKEVLSRLIKDDVSLSLPNKVLSLCASSNYYYILLQNGSSLQLLQYTKDLIYKGRININSVRNEFVNGNYQDDHKVPTRNLHMQYYQTLNEVLVPINIIVTTDQPNDYGINISCSARPSTYFTLGNDIPTTNPKVAAFILKVPDIAFDKYSQLEDGVSVLDRGSNLIITHIARNYEMNFYLIAEMSYDINKDINISTYSHELTAPIYSLNKNDIIAINKSGITKQRWFRGVHAEDEDFILNDLKTIDNRVFILTQPINHSDYYDLKDHYHIIEDIIDIPQPRRVR
jgi:hypothetical protein